MVYGEISMFFYTNSISIHISKLIVCEVSASNFDNDDLYVRFNVDIPKGTLDL